MPATKSPGASGLAVHRRLAPGLLVLLAFMAVTGGGWTLAYRVAGAGKADVKWMLRWHQGDVFDRDSTGAYVRAPFCAAVGVATIGLAASGATMLSTRSARKNRNTYRRAHQVLSWAAGLPLAMMGATGGAWAVGKYWLGLPKADLKWLLWLHQGGLEMLFPVYPPVLAMLTLALAATGFQLLSGGKPRVA